MCRIGIVDQASLDLEQEYEAIVPPWTETGQIETSPVSDGTAPSAASSKPTKRKRRNLKRGGHKKIPVPSEPSEPIVLRARPKPPIILNPDPGEQRYCYCNQVCGTGEVRGFGLSSLSRRLSTANKMVPCANIKDCEREWVSSLRSRLPTDQLFSFISVARPFMQLRREAKNGTATTVCLRGGNGGTNNIANLRCTFPI